MCEKGSIDMEIGKGQKCKDNGLIERDVTLRNLDK